MKKIIFILFFIPSFGFSGYGINETISEPINIQSTIQNPDFRGVWQVVNKPFPLKGNEIVSGIRIIWKDNQGQYKSVYMDNMNEVTRTIDTYIKNNKLFIKSAFERQYWEPTSILTLIDKNTIAVVGISGNGAFFQTLTRIPLRDSE